MTELENIDKKIIELIEKRTQLITETYQVNDGSLSLLTKNATNHFSRELKLHKELVSKKKRVGYLGPEGTFSHLMTQKIFANYADLIPLPSIDDVFDAVKKGKVENGVVPIENSINGSVTHTLDQLIKNSSKIQAEATLDIKHCFYSNCQSHEIKVIYSHPQAIGQCHQWLKENFRHAELIETSSTTKAIQKALEEPFAAAIAGLSISDHYEIKLINENIQDHSFNQTRFLVIGDEIPNVEGTYKTSLTVNLSEDRQGALFDLLKAFKENNINLTRIESRPSRAKAWQYIFFIDIDGNIEEKKIQKALGEVQKAMFTVNILGSYRKAI